MGAYDRDYWRSEPTSQTRSIGGGMKWTATIWIIVACVAIFVLDCFLPRQWVVTESKWQPELSDDVRRLILEGKIPSSTNLPEQNPNQIPVVEQPVFAQFPNSEPKLVAVNTLQSTQYIQKWLYFSTSTALFSTIPGVGTSALELWRFIGFQFCHASLQHLLFNMLGLFFFGPVVERYLGAKRFTAFYLICGIAGALVYLLLNFAGFMVTGSTNGRVMIPGLLSNDPDMPLIGASAGVFGIIIAAARLMPDATVLLFFVIPMRLKTLAYGLVLIAAASVIFNVKNAGGEAAHLGGAIAGWYFINRPQRLRSFFDFLGRADPTSTFHSARKVQRAGLVDGRGPSNAEIDRILDKVRSGGLGSLNESERRTLRDATRHRSDS